MPRPAIGVTIGGVDVVVRRLRYARENLSFVVERALDRAAQDVIRLAQERMEELLYSERPKWPYDRTYEAMEGFRIANDQLGTTKFKVTVKNVVPYFAYLEFGTEPHEIEPVEASKLRYRVWGQGGEPEWRKSEFEFVSGIPAYHFLQDALDAGEEFVRLRVAEALRDWSTRGGLPIEVTRATSDSVETGTPMGRAGREARGILGEDDSEEEDW